MVTASSSDTKVRSTIQTQAGHGRTVSIRLRWRGTPSMRRASPPPSITPCAAAGAAVEEEPMVREVVSEYLRRDQHEVSTAVTGREGLAKFEAGAFDLVVADLALEELNGERFGRGDQGAHAAMPVILLTGFADSAVSPEHRPAGIDAVLRKPLEPAHSGGRWRR